MVILLFGKSNILVIILDKNNKPIVIRPIKTSSLMKLLEN